MRKKMGCLLALMAPLSALTACGGDSAEDVSGTLPPETPMTPEETEFQSGRVEGGTYTVEVGVSSRDIISRLDVEIDDDGKIMNLDEWSTFGEWLDDPIGAPILQHVLDDMGKEAGRPIIPDSALMVMFLRSMPLRSLSVILGEAGEQVAANLTEAYRKATA